MADILEMDQRDWSDGLPQELINLISKKLSDISHFIRFRVVCKKWRLYAPASDPPPQLPWLLELKQKDRIFKFYSISLGKTYTIRYATPSIIWRYYGTSRGYMFAYGRNGADFSLVNPIAKDRVCLPPAEMKCASPLWMSANPNPLQSGEYVVAEGNLRFCTIDTFCLLDVERPELLAFYRPGDDKWTHMKWPESVDICYRSIIYKGKFLMMEFDTKITAIDINTLTLAYVIPPCENRKGASYLVESSGELLRIDKCKHESTREYIFNIYKLDVGNGKNIEPAWVTINSINDQMLFLDTRFGISIRATEFAGFRGNCIYYLEIVYNRKNMRDLISYPTTHLYRYNIEDQTTEELNCPINGCTWFIPAF